MSGAIENLGQPVLMLMLAIESAAHSCKGFGKRKDVMPDQQVVILGSDRMPKYALSRDRHLGNQVCPCQGDALRGGASKRNSSYYPVLLADVMGVKEVTKFFRLCVS